MDVAVLLGAAGAVLVPCAVVLAVVGSRRLARARGVRRVQVPARVRSSVPVPGGDLVDVEYPGPDGRVLRAQVMTFLVTAPGQPYTFDGTVWVDPRDPADVTPRRQGRTTAATVTLVLAAVALVLAVGLLAAAVVVGLAQALPAG